MGTAITAVVAAVLRHGGVEQDLAAGESADRTFLLDTPLGSLRVTVEFPPHGAHSRASLYTVFCRFTCGSVAAAVLGSSFAAGGTGTCPFAAVNPYSGKWNFHLPADEPPKAAAAKVVAALDQVMGVTFVVPAYVVTVSAGKKRRKRRDDQ